MLGMMGKKQRMMAMMGGGHSAPHGPYGPQQFSNGERGMRDYGSDQMKNRAGFLLGAQEIINAVKQEDPERLVRAFKSMHQMCHDEDGMRG